MYNALHGAVIREAQIDVQGNLNIQITDVWNFNKNRPSLRGRLGEKYQEMENLQLWYFNNNKNSSRKMAKSTSIKSLNANSRL